MPKYLLLLATLLTLPALAANRPCSGSKGGIARCDGPLFVCNDGSISGSKRTCSAGQAGAAITPAKSATSGSCPCGGGSYCTGPRGGHYCLTGSGKKSYLKQ